MRRLIALLVVLCLAPLALLTWFSVSLSAKAVRGQVDARVRNTAAASAVHVNEQMDGLAELVGSYAQRPSLVAAMGQPAARRDGEAITFNLKELRQARTGIAVASVVDPDGRLLDLVPPTPSIIGRDFSFRDWYRGVTRTNRPYISEAIVAASRGNARVVAVAVQIRAPATGGRQGRVLGILVAAYGLDTIQRFVDDYAAAQGVRLTVTDQRGVVVAAPGASHRGLQSRRDDPLVAAALERRSGISERTTPEGRVVSAYEPVPGLGWTVTADVATGTAFAPIAELRRTVLAIGAVLGLALLAGLFLLARALRRKARIEQQLKDGQARTQELLEATAEAFISIDADGLVTIWNPQATETFGWSGAEAVGRPLAELIVPEESRDADERGRRRFLETGEGPLLNRRVEVTALHKDGRRFPVEVVIWAVGSGPETTFNAFAHDISERRRAEEAVRASTERLGLALDASSMGYWDRDLASGQVVWSTALAGLLEVDPASLDHELALVQHVHPEDREAVARWVSGPADRGGPEELQFRLDGPEGSTRWMSGRARVYHDDDGQPVRKVGVVADITRRRHDEQALEQAKQDADQANRAKSEFLSSMSHELRTPLNAILGFGQLLQLDDLTQEQTESVDHMLRGGRHLLELINEVLDISRIESGNLSLSPEPVDVLEVVKDTVDLIRPLAAEREITVQAPSPADPSRTVRADRQRLKQVLLNLASNAVKYNRHGGTIRVACQATPEGRVAILVQDTGPGLSAEKLARMFTPFDRLGAEQSEVQGTGMGLALSKGLMEAMDGALRAESVEGQGSTFTVELPEVDGGGHGVLYVEDNASNQRLVERVLAERGGVRLRTTGHGEQVQGLVRQHRPELVLLDLHLPDVDGEEVLRRLKADPRTAEVPVVVISADVNPEHIERVLAAGAREYLTKPLDVARFRVVVDSLLSGIPSRP
jgi:PAS domain S-box-containing protein